MIIKINKKESPRILLNHSFMSFPIKMKGKRVKNRNIRGIISVNNNELIV